MYAVVRFADEESVSEVPVSWLYDDGKKCWWPNGVKNINAYITKAIAPNVSTWIWHDVTVETTGLSLEKARKKAADADYSSSDEINRGRGLRPKFFKNVNSDESEDCNFFQQKDCKRSTSVLLPPPQFPNQRNEHLEVIDNSTSNIDSLDIVSMPVIMEGQESSGDNISSPILTSVSCAHGDDIAEINANIQKFTRLLTSINLTLTNINSRLEKLEKNHVVENTLDNKYEDLEQFLPLESIEEIQKFNEHLMRNTEASSLFKNFISHIGGNSPKDNTNRILKRIFTNKCAMECSWMGHRNNFRVSTLLIIKFVKEVVCCSYTALKENEFESLGSEWFRFAKQRFNREQKES